MAAHDEERVKKRKRKRTRPEQLSETKREARTHKKRRALPRLLLRLVLIAALAVGCLWVSRNFDSLSPAAISDWFDETLAGGIRGDGFPLTVDGDAVVSVGALGDSLAVLSDNALTIYNKNAGELARRLHNYAEPALELAGSYALVAEIGGKRLTLGTRNDTMLEFTASDAIVTAAVAKNGRFAIATGADKSHTSKVTVYDRRGEELYSWVSAELQVVDLAFNAAGTQVAVAGITAKNAELYSALTVLAVSGSAPVSYEEAGVMLCAVGFADSDTVAAVGSDVLWLAAADGSGKTAYTYADQELLSYTISPSIVSLVLRSYGSADGGELVMLDETGQVTQTAAFADTFRHVAGGDSRVLLLTDRHLYSFKADGKRQQAETAADGRLTVSLANRALVMGLTAITDYPLVDNGVE